MSRRAHPCLVLATARGDCGVCVTWWRHAVPAGQQHAHVCGGGVLASGARVPRSYSGAATTPVVSTVRVHIRGRLTGPAYGSSGGEASLRHTVIAPLDPHGVQGQLTAVAR